VIDPYWVALPLHLRNAVSMSQPYWVCWDPIETANWVRSPPAIAITDPARFPFFQPPRTVDGVRTAMEFEEFVDEFGHWYGKGEATACFVGIRATESLNRWRAIAGRHNQCEDKFWTCWKRDAVYNAYPMFDWEVEDIWTFHGHHPELPYNRLYDRFHQAGLKLSQMRICQPYGDDQRRGLSMFHVIEPETWTKVVARVCGANFGALYCGVRGNILGNGEVTLPPGHTWESFTRFLLSTLPEDEAEHYRDKFAVFIHWWRTERGLEIVDEADKKIEAARKAPSWRRLAKAILRNDRMCKSLSFGQQVSRTTSWERYRKIMRERRRAWKINL
jgi:predicted phosphoadenosine phosphosulfate sulfurtransferase